MNRPTNFQAIQEKFRENIDYRIEGVSRNSRILVFTPHGGGIERGASELVRAIAGTDLAYYLFEGLRPTARESWEMHIASTKFDEPKCIQMIQKVERSLAIHGFRSSDPIIYAGGRDCELRDRITAALKQKDYPIRIATTEYKGTMPNNICNRTVNKKGVQLELSQGFRCQLFERWATRNGRRNGTDLFERFVSDIRSILLEAESGG